MIIGTLLIAAMTGIGFLMVGFSKRAWHDGKVNTWLQINYGLTPKQGLDLIAREFPHRAKIAARRARTRNHRAVPLLRPQGTNPSTWCACSKQPTRRGHGTVRRPLR